MGSDRMLNRRDVIKGGAALGAASLIHDDAIASALKEEPALSREIVALKKDLSEGGRYYAAMRNEPVDMETVREMVPRLVRIMRDFRPLHIAPEMAQSDESKFVEVKEMPGLITGTIDTYQFIKLYDGRRVPAARFCNFFMMHVQGADYLATANHCVAGAPAEKQFHVNAGIADIAVRRLKEGSYTGTMMTLDYHTSDEGVNGSLGTTVGTKNGLRDAFYGPLVTMTDPMYELFSEGEVIPDPLGSQIRNGFWKIIPPEQGMAERIVDGNVELRAQGRSGSMETVFDENRKGRVVAGNFIAVKRFTHGPFARQTVGFYSGPDAILSLIEEERGDVPIQTAQPAKPAPRKESDDWRTRIWNN